MGGFGRDDARSSTGGRLMQHNPFTLWQELTDEVAELLRHYLPESGATPRADRMRLAFRIVRQFESPLDADVNEANLLYLRELCRHADPHNAGCFDPDVETEAALKMQTLIKEAQGYVAQTPTR